MIQVACGGCGKVYRVPDEHAGKRTRCKQCSAVIAIPALPHAEEAVIEPAPVQPVESEPQAAAPAARRPMKMPPKKVIGGPKKPGGPARPPLARKPLQARPAGRPLSARKKQQADTEALDAVEGAKAANGSKRKVILLAVLGVAAAAAIGFAAFMFLGGREDAKPVTKPKAGGDAALVEGKEKKEAPGTKAAEKAAPAPEPAVAEVRQITDPLSIIPKGVGFVAKVDAGVVMNLPGAREGIQKKLEEMPQEKAILEEAGFDPLSNLRTIWIAGEPEKLMASHEVAPPPGGGSSPKGAPGKAAPPAPDADPSAVVLVDGDFDKEKFIGALTKARKITAKPKVLGKLEVYDFADGDGHLSLLSPQYLLLGAGKAFSDALALTEGGPSVRENQLLADLSGDFSSNPIAWAAIALPPSLAGQVEAQLQAKVEGAFLSVDRSADGEGAAIEMLVRCPSAEEAKKVEQGVTQLLDGLPLPVKPFLTRFKMQAEQSHLRLSLDLPRQLLEPLLSGGSPAGAAPAEGEGEAEEAGAEAGDEKAEAGAGEEEKAEPAGEEEKTEPAAEETAPPEEPAAEPKEEAAEEPEKPAGKKKK